MPSIAFSMSRRITRAVSGSPLRNRFADELAIRSLRRRRAVLSVTKALVLRLDRDRTSGPYHARHSSVTWQLILGKNLLWVAKQHGHSVEVMLRMYAAWLDGATEADIHAIKKAMGKRPDARAAFLDSRSAISAVNTVSNRVTQIVIRPLELRRLPAFGSRFGSRSAIKRLVGLRAGSRPGVLPQ
jgi:hypothetical protein